MKFENFFLWLLVIDIFVLFFSSLILFFFREIFSTSKIAPKVAAIKINNPRKYKLAAFIIKPIIAILERFINFHLGIKNILFLFLAVILSPMIIFGFRSKYNSYLSSVFSISYKHFSKIPFALTGFILAPLWLVILLLICVHASRKRKVRQEKALKPRLVWGPYPNYTAVEISKALKPYGYECDTYIYYNFDRIWKGESFTFCLASRFNWLPYLFLNTLAPVTIYPFIFIKLIYNYDIFHGNFYPGYLRGSLLELFELQLMQIAGCKRISISTGGDVAFTTDINSHVIRQGIQDMYPHSASNFEQKSIKKWINYYSENSDYIICQNSYMIDTLPRWDLLVTSYAPIDMDFWKSDFYTENNGKNGVVKIGHSPNHRPLKGTNFLIRAVNELRNEGYKIELVLLENNQNSEVRDILGNCDIVVADVVLQGYSIMAIEGLALGRPVVQDISDSHYNRVFKLYTGMDEAPFVSAPLEDIKQSLLELINNPSLRLELGRKGRDYAKKYHSYEAVGKFWDWVYEDVWFNSRERIGFYHPDWPISTIKSLNAVQPSIEEARLAEDVKANLNYHNKNYKDKRIGYYPFNSFTESTILKLVRTRVIKSNDFLILDPNEPVPQNLRMHLPQEVIPLDEFNKRGGKYVYLLSRNSNLESSLANLDWSKNKLSVNDLHCIYCPPSNQIIREDYRKLALNYTQTVVQPLHFSNFAYIQHLKSIVSPDMSVVDICTGPGTIGLSLMRESKIGNLALIDLNPKAIKMCRKNIELNFPSKKNISTYISDIFESVPADLTWDLIIGNPPHNLDEGNHNKNLPVVEYIQAHDPNLEFHKKFFAQSKSRLNPGGRICLLENGDKGCITANHIEAILDDALEIESWDFLPESQFYIITIKKR